MARGLVVAVVLVAAVLSGGWAPGAARPAAAASWSLPVAGAVARPFAPPAHRYGAGHRGVDLAAYPGTAVRAAGAGRVSYAGLLAGRGVLVVVHGALRTTYEPVTATVGLGDTVAGGQVIGTLEPGHAGCPAPACLHWGLRRGEDYLDPLRLVEPGPVRLLPVGGGAAAPAPGDPAPGPPARGGGGSGAEDLPVRRSAAATGPATGPARGPTGGGGGAPAALAALGAGAVLAGAALRRS